MTPFPETVSDPNRRHFSEREKNHHVNPSEVQPRKRSSSTLCGTISEINPDNPDSILHDSRFTDAVRKLSKEEMASLYQDIVKPVDPGGGGTAIYGLYRYVPL